MKAHLLLSMALALALAAPAAPALAFGGGSSSSATSSTSTSFDAGKRAVDAGDYGKAVTLLSEAVAAEPKNADAYNLLGFSYRKLGKLDEAFESYRKALALNANHRGANEYIGELYLELGALDKAEEHLARLGKACAYSCPEYRELKQAVAEFKASKGG